MLIQDAIFPNLDEKDVKPAPIKVKEEQTEAKEIPLKEETPKNKGGRPRKN